MIRVTATTEGGARAFLIDLGDRVTDRAALNRALAERLAEELVDHWTAKNKKGNKLGGKRTNFWLQAAQSTAVESVTEDGAVVATGGDAGQRIRIHIFGGTIVPKVAESLTIPIVREAHGLRAAEYQQKTGNNLFTLPGVNVLFEAPGEGRGGDRSVTAETAARGRDSEGRATSITLQPRRELRPVYALSKKAKIDADPDALPAEAELVAALQEEAEDWLDATEGGLA